MLLPQVQPVAVFAAEPVSAAVVVVAAFVVVGAELGFSAGEEVLYVGYSEATADADFCAVVVAGPDSAAVAERAGSSPETLEATSLTGLAEVEVVHSCCCCRCWNETDSCVAGGDAVVASVVEMAQKTGSCFATAQKRKWRTMTTGCNCLTARAGCSLNKAAGIEPVSIAAVAAAVVVEAAAMTLN